MLSYKEMKKRLKESREKINLKHFTEEFYNIFVGALRANDWNPVFDTDFYKLDGSSYCHFLEEFYGTVPYWRLDFFMVDKFFRSVPLGYTFVHAETAEDAKNLGEKMMERYEAEYVDVTAA